MPELPEVETIRRDLAPELEGHRITAVRVHHDDIIIGTLSGAEFRDRIEGRRILGVARRAKWLLLRLDDGILVTQLRMTGRFAVGRGSVPPVADFRHVAAEFDLDDGRTLGCSCVHCAPSHSHVASDVVSQFPNTVNEQPPNATTT